MLINFWIELIFFIADLKCDFKTGSKKNLVADGKAVSTDAGKTSDTSATSKSVTPKDNGAAA